MRPAGKILRLSLVALALLLAGCIRYEEHVTFGTDGSGTFELKFGFDMTLFKNLEGADGQPEVDTSGFAERLGDDLVLESLAEELDGRTYEGFRLEVGFASAERFEDLARSVAEGAGQSSAEGGRLATELSLSASGNSYTLTGVIPPLLDPENRDAPFAHAVFSTARRSFRLTVPGRVTSSNADTQEGTTLTWTLDPLSTAERPVSVTWTVTP